MARTAHDADHRALRRFADVLVANLGAEITADIPTGLNLPSLTAERFYVLSTERQVREHVAAGNPRFYIYRPDNIRSVEKYTGGALVPAISIFKVAIAAFVFIEAGADEFEESWKDLDTTEREQRRLHVINGAIWDAVATNIIDGDDVLHTRFSRSEVGVAELKRNPDDPGTWSRIVFDTTQIIQVPQQSA